jgi:hypothetical protein
VAAGDPDTDESVGVGGDRAGYHCAGVLPVPALIVCSHCVCVLLIFEFNFDAGTGPPRLRQHLRKLRINPAQKRRQPESPPHRPVINPRPKALHNQYQTPPNFRPT